MVGAAFNTWVSEAKYWANGDVGRENSLDAAYTKLGYSDAKYRYYDIDVGKAGDFVGWSTARKTITLNGRRTTIVALILRGGGYGGEWVSNLHTGAGHAHSGFIIPVNEVFTDLKNYLAAAQKAGELGLVKLWMGGVHHESCRPQAGRYGQHPHPCPADRGAGAGRGPLLRP